MRRTSLALSLAAAMSLSTWAFAQNTPTALTGSANNAASDVGPSDLLGDHFDSEAAGISLRLPKGLTRLAASGVADDIGQFGDETRKWQLKLTRVLRSQPTSLSSSTDNFGKTIPGYLDQALEKVKLDLPGCKVLRQDLTNIADGDPKVKDNVAMIAVRYTGAGAHYLLQQAIVEANERLFYLITLTTPASNGNLETAPPDDNERTAVETFRQMLDSVRLLDSTKIRREQNERLYRTRALFVNWTRTRLHAALLDEQWLRIIKDGKDVGYSYITEKPAGGVPRPLRADEIRQGKSERDLIPPGDGVLVGIRARSMVPAKPDPATGKTPKDSQVDSETWLYVTPDRRLEDWSRVTYLRDGAVDKNGKPVVHEVDEFGSSTLQTMHVLDKLGRPGTKNDDKQPPVRIEEKYSLDVTSITETGASTPLNQELPPWYLPQALGHLLPRLLPLEPRVDGQPRTYMFATYIPETREVMTRYVEVGDPIEVTLGGKTQRAIPVTDRIGWRGSVTTHYMSPDGKYLGSENKDTHTMILPTDGQTLLKIWKGANLTQPGAVQRPRGSASAAQTGGR